MRKKVYTKKGAKPAGPYSQGLVARGKLVYVSGQGPADPQTGVYVEGGIKEQAAQVFKNIQVILEEAGTSWANALKVSVFLADLKDFSGMNEVYQTFLTEPYPCRTTVQVGLPAGMLLEVDCIALVAKKPKKAKKVKKDKKVKEPKQPKPPKPPKQE
jgi:2-iminobutanoate/2-iminopropanoate deaminase